MKRELTCVTCPFSCRLSAEGDDAENLIVSGNRCKRGLAYAKAEIFDPKRLVTGTVGLAPRVSPSSQVTEKALDAPAPEHRPHRLPCRTRSGFPRDRIPELLGVLGETRASLPVRAGDVLVNDLLGTGIDLIATRSLSE
jgi:CxxC motif-containing protein